VVVAPVPIATYSDPSELLSFPLLGSLQGQEAASDGPNFLTDAIVSAAATLLGLLLATCRPTLYRLYLPPGDDARRCYSSDAGIEVHHFASQPPEKRRKATSVPI
jgi:hypothetical protein